MNRKTNDYIIIAIATILLCVLVVMVIGDRAEASSSGWTKVCNGTVRVKPLKANSAQVICVVSNTSSVTSDTSVSGKSVSEPYPAPPTAEPNWPYVPPPDYSNETPLPKPPWFYGPTPTLAPTMKIP